MLAAQKFLLLLASAAVVLGLAEVLARAAGQQPYQPRHLEIQVHPGGRLMRQDEQLGYSYLPGRYAITLPTGHTFLATHDSSGHRVTGGDDQQSGQHDRYDRCDREEVWILGCSLTYGWSLNDAQTFPWLLQQQWPHTKVVNFGVGGYSNVQSLIQLRTALQQGRAPGVAILAYSRLHDRRNTVTRRWKKSVVPWRSKFQKARYPRARIRQGQLQIRMEPISYRELPLMRWSALSHFVETRCNSLQERIVQSHRVTEAVFLELHRLARQHRFTLILAGILDSRWHQVERFAAAHGIPAVDIRVDLNAPGNRNWPYDSHPSALANAQYCARLSEFLSANGCVGPPPVEAASSNRGR